MDTTLVINPGSSSKKYALFSGERELLSVLFEHTEEGYGRCIEVNRKRERCESIEERAYEDALDEVITIAKREGVLSHHQEISGVGIRVVSPGTYSAKHRIITSEYLEYLQALSVAAPLHVPHLLRELNALKRVLPDVQVVGVSDSAFHATLPESARRFSIPEKDAVTHDVYRFGYHGISVASCVRQVGERLGEIPKKMIVAHVGSGVSVTALRDGKSVETTMSFGPGDGLLMGTRAGDVSTSALIYLMRMKDLTPDSAEEYLNKEGGFRGLLGQNDLRVVLDRMSRGDATARVAVEMFVHNLKKAIGAFAAVLGGVDLIVLTATAAERNPVVRSLALSGLEHLGIILDRRENESLMGRPGIISREDSAASVLVLHTREMEEIARVAQEVLRG